MKKIGSISVCDKEMDMAFDAAIDEIEMEFPGDTIDELSLSEGLRILFEKLGLPKGTWDIPFKKLTVEQARKVKEFAAMIDESTMEFVPSDEDD